MKYFENLSALENQEIGNTHRFKTLFLMSVISLGFLFLLALFAPEKSEAIQKHELTSEYTSRHAEEAREYPSSRYQESQMRREETYHPITRHLMGGSKAETLRRKYAPTPPYEQTRPKKVSEEAQRETSHVAETRQPRREHPVEREKAAERQAVPRHEVIPQESRAAERGVEKEHIEKPEEEHVVKMSPIPGVTFTETLIKLLDHELNGRFLGWRPNDLIIGRFTDNINNFQLGVLEAVRITAVKLKESLSRLGESDAYDPDLQMAVNLLMNKSTSFWFPSAESSYKDALEHLKKYEEKLKTGRAHFYYRVDTLSSLVSTYRDFLGNVNNNLTKNEEKDGSEVSWFKADDYFYYAQGVSHVMYEILKVVQVGFHEQLVTIDAVDIMKEAIHELHRGVSMSPWIILDRPLDSLFANHRANLSAVLGEATHLLTTMTQL